MSLRNLIYLLGFFAFLCVTSQAWATERTCREYLLTDEEFAHFLPYAQPWYPDDRLAFAYPSPREDLVYALLYQSEPGSKVYCYGLSNYLMQIRILDSCPEGVDGAGLPCVDIIEENGIGYEHGSPSSCSAMLLTFNAGWHGTYMYRAGSKYVTFPCGDLDKLVERGELPPGKVLMRDFRGSEVEDLYEVIAPPAWIPGE